MKKESNVQKLVLLQASAQGATLWRNNSGAYTTKDGYFLRYGIPLTGGGSDLIGITPVVITAEMVGETLGVFTAVEVKTKTGTPTKKQLEFISFVKSRGGFAGIARTQDDVKSIVKIK